MAVCAIRSLMVGPWPCSTAVISVASLFTSAGRSRSKSGLNALNSAVRSRPGLVRETGMVAPGGSRLSADAAGDVEVALADQVEEVDLGVAVGVHLLVARDGEGDLGHAVLELAVLHPAHAYAGHPHVVALGEAVGVAEERRGTPAGRCRRSSPACRRPSASSPPRRGRTRSPRCAGPGALRMTYGAGSSSSDAPGRASGSCGRRRSSRRWRRRSGCSPWSCRACRTRRGTASAPPSRSCRP